MEETQSNQQPQQEVNQEQVVVPSTLYHSTHLEDLLIFIEQNIPIDAMYGDLSSDKQVSTSDDVEFSLVKETFQSQLRRIRESGYSESQYVATRASLLAILPYSNFKSKLEDVNA